MRRDDLRDMWKVWWDGDIWIASWEKGLAGITAEQALWTPAPNAHCIWQLIRHVIFWRDVTLSYLRDGDGRPSEERLESEHFGCPRGPDGAAWAALQAELRASHDALYEVLADESQSDERLRHHLAHDSYHLGQIMYLRRLHGFDVVMPP